MNRHLCLLIAAGPFLGCSPVSEEPDPADPIDTGELPYVVHGENEGIPEYDEDTLVSLVESALAELVTIDATPLLDAYDALMTHAESGCPDWLNTNGYTYWVDDCTTEDGTLFDGFGTQLNLEDYEDPDGTIWNQRAIFMLGEIQDVEGNGLVGTGAASEATAVNTGGQQITMTNIVQGYELGGDVATGSWLDGESSPRLYSYTLTGAGGEGFVIYIDALAELDSDEVDLLAIEEMVIYDEPMGSDCPIEPAGSMSLRMASGEWLDLSFDGPRWDGPTDPEVCDGCGEIWAKEVPLGELCLDFDVLFQAESEGDGGG
jgi:hypothetical protein